MKIPLFGVCLGLQGIVEHFGGELAVLDYPMHGKPSTGEYSSEGAAREWSTVVIVIVIFMT